MASEEDLARRVKLYQLNDGGQWDDKGTGHVQHTTADDGDGEFVILTVMCEETGEVLLEHKIENRPDFYQRQGDTIITWCEESSGMDLALSFQEKQHCDEVWDQIKDSHVLNPSDFHMEDRENHYEVPLSLSLAQPSPSFFVS
jgi:protein phosphatase-4 regulatory subunit 3